MIGEFTGGPELVPASLRGFRSWDIHCGDPWRGARVTVGLLRASFKVHTWRPGVNTAGCLSDTTGRYSDAHESPARGCRCGFYATYRSSLAPRSVVSGSIKATGRVIMGNKGFRAEKVEVEALVIPRGMAPEVAFVLAKTVDIYNVPAFETWEALLEQFPEPDVSELVGFVPTAKENWFANITDQQGAWRLCREDAELLWEWCGLTEYDTDFIISTLDTAGYYGDGMYIQGSLASRINPGLVHFRTGGLTWGDATTKDPFNSGFSSGFSAGFSANLGIRPW